MTPSTETTEAEKQNPILSWRIKPAELVLLLVPPLAFVAWCILVPNKFTITLQGHFEDGWLWMNVVFTCWGLLLIILLMLKWLIKHQLNSRLISFTIKTGLLVWTIYALSLL